MLAEIDDVVRRSLTSLVDDISRSDWTGRREREVVSLFCFGHLATQCRPDGFLYDLAQIAIEVAVAQNGGQVRRSGKASSKDQVCKDIVIWPKPRMTCWDSGGRPTVRPASIIEWKHNEGSIYEYDVDWLCEFSREIEDFVGYAVSTNLPDAHKFRLLCTRIHRGQILPDFLCIK